MVRALASRWPAAREPTKRLFLRIRALMRRAFSAALLRQPRSGQSPWGIGRDFGMDEEAGEPVPIIEDVAGAVGKLVAARIGEGDALGFGLDVVHDRAGAFGADAA